jgi:hypothetical protein
MSVGRQTTVAFSLKKVAIFVIPWREAAMPSYPVFDCSREARTASSATPIGYAASNAEAIELLERHFAGIGASPPAVVALGDRGKDVWAYWIVPELVW